MTEVICIKSEAFYALIDKVLEHIKVKEGITENKWVDTETAMTILNIKSKTTLQSLRDNREIIFSQPKAKIILYDRESLNAYLTKYKRE